MIGKRRKREKKRLEKNKRRLHNIPNISHTFLPYFLLINCTPIYYLSNLYHTYISILVHSCFQELIKCVPTVRAYILIVDSSGKC